MDLGLQELVDKLLDNILRTFLQKVVSGKLEEEGLTPSKKDVEDITSALMSGHHAEPDPERSGVIIHFDEKDIKECESKVEYFFENQMDNVIDRFIYSASDVLLKSMKKGWKRQAELEIKNFTEFQLSLQRWKVPINLLKMLLTLSREVCLNDYAINAKNARADRCHLDNAIQRLHARACQITSEIILLLETGYDDGAMARWRTLHEISVIVILLGTYGNELAERYLAHEIVESKKSLDIYEKNFQELGFKAVSKRDYKSINSLYNKAIKKYGKSFERDYGWAAKHISPSNSFSDLAAAANKSNMKSYYRMASQNIHAGVKGITHRLGNLHPSSFTPVGASNAGLEEPGQNVSLTFAVITSVALQIKMGSEDSIDRLVIMKTVSQLQKELVESFINAWKKLNRDYRRNVRSGV